MYTTPQDPHSDANTLPVVRFKSFPTASSDVDARSAVPSPPPRTTNGELELNDKKMSLDICLTMPLFDEFVEQDDEDGNEFRTKADDVGNGGTGAVHEKPLAMLLRSAAPTKATDGGLCILDYWKKVAMSYLQGTKLNAQIGRAHV